MNENIKCRKIFSALNSIFYCFISNTLLSMLYYVVTRPGQCHLIPTFTSNQMINVFVFSCTNNNNKNGIGKHMCIILFLNFNIQGFLRGTIIKNAFLLLTINKENNFLRIYKNLSLKILESNSPGLQQYGLYMHGQCCVD